MGTFLLAVVSRNEPHQVTRPQPLQTVASNVGVASMTALQIQVPTGTIGQLGTVAHPPERSSEGPLDSETCRNANARNSADAAIGEAAWVRQQYGRKLAEAEPTAEQGGLGNAGRLNVSDPQPEFILLAPPQHVACTAGSPGLDRPATLGGSQTTHAPTRSPRRWPSAIALAYRLRTSPPATSSGCCLALRPGPRQPHQPRGP
jgi:hypothetical protein